MRVIKIKLTFVVRIWNKLQSSLILFSLVSLLFHSCFILVSFSSHSRPLYIIVFFPTNNSNANANFKRNIIKRTKTTTTTTAWRLCTVDIYKGIHSTLVYKSS